jgi:hypothetical protein
MTGDVGHFRPAFWVRKIPALTASKAIMKDCDTVPKFKDILAQLDKLQEEKNTLMQEYSKSNDIFSDLVLHKKNYNRYMDKEVER